MQKTFVLFILLLCFQEVVKAQDIFKTPSGQKYHLGSCHMVKNVSERITLPEAQELGLEACLICKPPVSVMKAILISPQLPRGRIKTVQCIGITKNGTRCKHMTRIGNKYCFQHLPN